MPTQQIRSQVQLTIGLAVAIGLLLIGRAAISAEDQTLHTAVKLQQPKKSAGRTDGALDEVPLAIWIPGDAKVVRGAVFNPFYIKAVGQKHWQAFCRQHDFALVAANYFAVKSDEFRPTLLTGLKQFAADANRPELAHIPICPVGMSAGAGMSTRFAEQMPERTIAAGPVCLEVGPRNSDSFRVPMITVFGDRDGKQLEKLLAKLPDARGDNAQWALAPQWGRKHEFGQANNILFPMFDRVVRHRCPDGKLPTDGPVALVDYRHGDGWLGDITNWSKQPAPVAAANKFDGDSANTVWLPDQYMARTWQAFVAPHPIKIKQPAGLGDGQPFQIHPAGQAVEVAIALPADAAYSKVELFAGDKPLGTFASGAVELATPKLPAGIHALYVRATSGSGQHFSRVHTIIVAEQ